MKYFEQYIAKLWDKVMAPSRWDQWEEDVDGQSDIMRFATEIAREAFADGVDFGVNYPHATCGDMMVAMDKRYPLPKPEVKYRTAGPDSNGNRWQVRDGITWISHNYKPFHQHVPLADVLDSMRYLEAYADLALLASLAANPTEE